MQTIITHSSPDIDAIVYSWLMKSYWLKDATINFMRFNALDEYALAKADSVGDMGCVYDPDNLRFDHHHLPGSLSTSTCAAKMAWEFLLSKGVDVYYLDPLIEAVYQGDIAQSAPVGIHAQMFGWKSRAKEAGRDLADQEIYEYGVNLIEPIAFWLKKKDEATAELNQKVIWESDDGLVWAIENGSARTSFAAYDEGARVVVFQGAPIETDQGVSYPVGATRSPEWGAPHLGELVGKIIAKNEEPLLCAELETWFRHNDGFFVGRGGAKAPCGEALQVDLVKVAQAISDAWWRLPERSQRNPTLENLLHLASQLPAGLNDVRAADKLLAERGELLAAIEAGDEAGALTEIADGVYYAAKHLDWLCRLANDNFGYDFSIKDLIELAMAKYELRARPRNPKDAEAERAAVWSVASEHKLMPF